MMEQQNDPTIEAMTNAVASNRPASRRSYAAALSNGVVIRSLIVLACLGAAVGALEASKSHLRKGQSPIASRTLATP
jgi:hypothetical protein